MISHYANTANTAHLHLGQSSRLSERYMPCLVVLNVCMIFCKGLQHSYKVFVLLFSVAFCCNTKQLKEIYKVTVMKHHTILLSIYIYTENTIMIYDSLHPPGTTICWHNIQYYRNDSQHDSISLIL